VKGPDGIRSGRRTELGWIEGTKYRHPLGKEDGIRMDRRKGLGTNTVTRTSGISSGKEERN